MFGHTHMDVSAFGEPLIGWLDRKQKRARRFWGFQFFGAGPQTPPCAPKPKTTPHGPKLDRTTARVPRHAVVIQMAVGQNQWYHFGKGEFTHFRTFVSGGLGCSPGVRFGFLPMVKSPFLSLNSPFHGCCWEAFFPFLLVVV